MKLRESGQIVVQNMHHLRFQEQSSKNLVKNLGWQGRKDSTLKSPWCLAVWVPRGPGTPGSGGRCWLMFSGLLLCTFRPWSVSSTWHFQLGGKIPKFSHLRRGHRWEKYGSGNSYKAELMLFHMAPVVITFKNDPRSPLPHQIVLHLECFNFKIKII